MIRFTGREAFRVPADHLFASLSDAGFLAGCMSDAEVQSTTADRAIWKLKPKLSFLSGSLETDLRMEERIPTSAVRFLIHGKAVGATSTTAAELKFVPTDDGCEVDWTAEITALTGLLKMVPKGLIQAAAEKVIADVWASVRAKIESSGAT